MNEKKKTQLEVVAHFQTAMLEVLKELLNGKREEDEDLTVEAVIYDISAASNIMGKIMINEQGSFNEYEQQLYDTMALMMGLKNSLEIL